MAKGKKMNGKKVDTILVVLIAIVVLAIIALGIVLVISLNTPDVIEPKDTARVTDTSGSYSSYLEEQMKEIGYKELPITSRLASGQTANYTTTVLGTDNNVYLVSASNNPDTIPGAAGTYTAGNKYNVENVVDIFGVETTSAYYVFALTVEGKLYRLDLISATASSNSVDYKGTVQVKEVYAEGDNIIVKGYDDETTIINGDL